MHLPRSLSSQSKANKVLVSSCSGNLVTAFVISSWLFMASSLIFSHKLGHPAHTLSRRRNHPAQDMETLSRSWGEGRALFLLLQSQSADKHSQQEDTGGSPGEVARGEMNPGTSLSEGWDNHSRQYRHIEKLASCYKYFPCQSYPGHVKSHQCCYCTAETHWSHFYHCNFYR